MNEEKNILQQILKWLSKPWILAAFLSLLVFLILPFPNKYTIKYNRSSYKSEMNHEFFYDLNSDGDSEKISFSTEKTGLCSFIVFDDDIVIDQWVIKGTYLRVKPIFFSDFNNNGLAEIYTLSQLNDSIFLNCIEPFSRKIYADHLFISKAKSSNGTFDTGCEYMSTIEWNGNSNKELMFGLYSGYPLFPRKVIVVDIAKNVVYSTKSTGLNFIEPYCYDIDGDGKDEIFGYAPSFGNTTMNTELTDQLAWLFFYNNHLGYYYPPKVIGKYPSKTTIFPYKSESGTGAIVVYAYSGDDDHSWIAKYSLNGELIDKNENKLFSSEISPLFMVGRDYFFAFQVNGMLFKIDDQLNVLETKQIRPNSKLIYDGDFGEGFQYLFKDAYGNLTLYDNDFIDRLELPKYVENNQITDISFLKNKTTGRQELVIAGDKETAFFTLNKNLFHWLFIPLIILFFAGIWQGIQLVYLSQKRRVEREFGIQKRIAELQLKSLHNQLDPHFTLNLINSIGSLFISQKTEEANYYFGKYAKLLREMILNSDKIEIPLNDEIEYCKTYLQLEQFRMENKFEFKVIIDSNVNLEYAVPRLMLHTFIENAIKHGIRHLTERKGKIEISVHQSSQLIIRIKDNGVGRNTAREFSSDSTGKGLEMIDETIKNYSDLKNREIEYFIRDVYNITNEPEGTEVTIIL